MKFLNELNLDEIIINDIIEHNGDAITTDLDSNYHNVKTNYELLKYLGIKCFEQLLIYEIDIFLIDTDVLKNSLEKINNIKDFIDNVNEDFFYIENLI